MNEEMCKFTSDRSVVECYVVDLASGEVSKSRLIRNINFDAFVYAQNLQIRPFTKLPVIICWSKLWEVWKWKVDIVRET